MPQTSLTTWLNQPVAVKEPPVAANQLRLSDKDLSTQKVNVPSPSSHAEFGRNGTSQSILPKLRPLPSNVEMRRCTIEDIPSLKRLTTLLLPIPYPEKFYKEIIEDSVTSSITLLAVWHDDPAMSGKQKGRLVGAIRCRLLAHAPSQANSSGTNDSPMLYLSTLALLSPYRNHGIATHLLHALTRRAIDDYGVSSIGAHVWESNTAGLEWYRKRGFREVGREAGYYRRLHPQSAIVMQRDVRVSDFAVR